MKYIKNIKRLKKLLLIAALFSIFVLTSQHSFAGDSYGIDPETKEAVKARASAMVGYDVATNENAVNSPKSVALLSCFNQSVKTNTSVTGSLFSGGFNKQAPDKVLKEDYDRYLKGEFEKDDFVTADDLDMKWKMGLSIEGSISIGPDSSGPKVKGIKCDKMNKLWEKKRNADTGDFPSFAQATENLLSGKKVDDATPGGETFNAVWGTDQDTKDELLKAEQKMKERESKRIDPDFSGDESPCEVLKQQGAVIDCDAVRRNGN